MVADNLPSDLQCADPPLFSKALYIGGREVLAHEVLVGGECPQVKRLAVDVAVRARLVRVRVGVGVRVRVRVRIRVRGSIA